MRLHRFFTTENLDPGKEVTITSSELSNQIRRVFRLKSGDEIILFNGTGFDYLAKIVSFGGSDKIQSESIIVLVDATAKKRSRFEPGRKLVLYAAVVKKDTFEWIVQKATELGVTDIVPVMAERSEKKNLNEERLKKIAIEASEQSGRGDVPIIHEIALFEDAVKSACGSVVQGTEKGTQVVAFHLEGDPFTASKISNTEPLAVFIGPEGGWSDAEVEMFHKNSIGVSSLGTQVLRAETAVVAALSLVVFAK